MCIHYSNENSKQQRKNHKQSVSFLFLSFFFAEGREQGIRIFVSQERESMKRKKEAMIKFLMGGKISFSFSRHNIESSVIEHIRT